MLEASPRRVAMDGSQARSGFSPGTSAARIRRAWSPSGPLLAVMDTAHPAFEAPPGGGARGQPGAYMRLVHEGVRYMGWVALSRVAIVLSVGLLLLALVVAIGGVIAGGGPWGWAL